MPTLFQRFVIVSYLPQLVLKLHRIQYQGKTPHWWAATDCFNQILLTFSLTKLCGCVHWYKLELNTLPRNTMSFHIDHVWMKLIDVEAYENENDAHMWHDQWEWVDVAYVVWEKLAKKKFKFLCFILFSP